MQEHRLGLSLKSEVAMACVQVSDSADRGQVLVCTQDIPAGHLMLVEHPVFLARAASSTISFEVLLEWYDAFQDLDRTVQEDILSNFFCPMESRYAAEVARFLQSNAISTDADRICHLAVIMHFNAAAAQPAKEDGSQPDPRYKDQAGLYPTMCKAAHSCAPNACWCTVKSTGTKEMRSIVPITSGSEVI